MKKENEFLYKSHLKYIFSEIKRIFKKGKNCGFSSVNTNPYANTFLSIAKSILITLIYQI